MLKGELGERTHFVTMFVYLEIVFRLRTLLPSLVQVVDRLVNTRNILKMKSFGVFLLLFLLPALLFLI